jgi:hypothetical protein
MTRAIGLLSSLREWLRRNAGNRSVPVAAKHPGELACSFIQQGNDLAARELLLKTLAQKNEIRDVAVLNWLFPNYFFDTPANPPPAVLLVNQKCGYCNSSRLELWRTFGKPVSIEHLIARDSNGLGCTRSDSVHGRAEIRTCMRTYLLLIGPELHSLKQPDTKIQ